MSLRALRSRRLAPVALLLACLGATSALAQDPPWETGKSRGEDLKVSLVTFGPGDDVESWWGHASLVVQDTHTQDGVLYNYGMFSFDEKMLMRFAMGRLEFWVGEAPIGATLRDYRAQNRTVHIQTLNLLPAERLIIAKALADNVLPQNRDYLYDHYRDNCATRPRDMIDRAIGGQLKAATAGPARYSLRKHTQRYTAVNAPMSVFLDFMMNGSIDKPLNQQGEAFLPDELEQQVGSLKFKNANGEIVPLSLGTNVWASSSRAPTRTTPPNYIPYLLALGVTLGGIAVLLGIATARGSRVARIALGSYQALVGFVLALLGTVLVIMWIVTNHTVTYHNENLFLANPLTWLLVTRGISLARGKRADAAQRLFRAERFLAVLVVLGLVLKALPMFNQDNSRVLALLIPLQLGFLLAAHFARSRSMPGAPVPQTGGVGLR